MRDVWSQGGCVWLRGSLEQGHGSWTPSSFMPSPQQASPSSPPLSSVFAGALWDHTPGFNLTGHSQWQNDAQTTSASSDLTTFQM